MRQAWRTDVSQPLDISTTVAAGAGDPVRRTLAELSFGIPSKLPAVALTVEMVRRMMEMLALDNDWVSRTELCLQEALLNAHFHGNHSDPERMIYLHGVFSVEKIELQIEDQGGGYDLNRHVSNIDTIKPTGRGLFLIRELMDSVLVNSKGNQIVMSLTKESKYGNQCYAG
jgi:serine/threonine-protein kinase RsbW